MKEPPTRVPVTGLFLPPVHPFSGPCTGLGWTLGILRSPQHPSQNLPLPSGRHGVSTGPSGRWISLGCVSGLTGPQESTGVELAFTQLERADPFVARL